MRTVIVTEVGAYLPKEQPCVGSPFQKGQDIAGLQDRATNETDQRNNLAYNSEGNQVKLTDEVEVEVVQESNIMGINSQLGKKQQPS